MPVYRSPHCTLDRISVNKNILSSNVELFVFRSESFKEDKEILLTRLRIYKTKDDPSDQNKSPDSSEKPPRYRRKSTRSDDSVEAVSENAIPPTKESSKTKSSTDLPTTKPAANHTVRETEVKKETKPMTESLKSRAAIFEQNTQRVIQPPNSLHINKTAAARFPSRDQTTTTTTTTTTKQTDLYAKNSSHETTYSTTNKEKMYGVNDTKESFDDLKDLDFIRNKRGDSKRDEHRRHTYETRERELEADRFKRISLESRSPM